MYLETYSSKCKTAIADINKLRIEYEMLTNKTPFWMAKGNIGPFQYRSLGVIYPETEGVSSRVTYNEYIYERYPFVTS